MNEKAPTIQQFCEVCQRITAHIIIKNQYVLCVPCVKRHEAYEQTRD